MLLVAGFLFHSPQGRCECDAMVHATYNDDDDDGDEDEDYECSQSGAVEESTPTQERPRRPFAIVCNVITNEGSGPREFVEWVIAQLLPLPHNKLCGKLQRR